MSKSPRKQREKEDFPDEEDDDEEENSLHMYLPPEVKNSAVNLSDINLEEADDEDEDVFY